MLPHIRYIVAKNPAYQIPFTPVEPQFFEESKREFEWSKAHNKRLDWFTGTYEDYAIYLAKNDNERLQRAFDAQLTMLKVGIYCKEDIKKVEEREDFVRWWTSDDKTI